MKKILLIGNGAREHVIAETFKRSPQEVSLLVYAKATNPGIAEMADEYMIGELNNIEKILGFAQEHKPDFAFIGPENPISDGVADALLKLGVHSVAPLQIVAQLEASKGFTRELFEKHSIPGNPLYKIFIQPEGIEDYIKNELGEAYVVKADGLMGGKGVKVSGEHLHTVEEGLEFAEQCIEKFGRVVVEEKFVGEEFSLMCFCDGHYLTPMPCVQDHKRAYDGDKGPNTGGMGSYSDANHSLPFLLPENIKEATNICKKTMIALREETGTLFKGIMYGGFIVTKHGVKLIEYNVRFGDPEAMNVLPILETDFVEICEKIIDEKLDEVNIKFANKATVCKYVVPEGYPENPVKNEKIEVGEIPENVKLYYAAVDQRKDGLYLSSSRAIGFVGVGNTLEEAEKAASSAVGRISGPVFYRNDIGTMELINKRIEHMNKLRV